MGRIKDGTKLYEITRGKGTMFLAYDDVRTLTTDYDWHNEENEALESIIYRIFSWEFEDHYMDHCHPHIAMDVTPGQYEGECFIDWLRKNHPELEPFEAKYIGPIKEPVDRPEFNAKGGVMKY